MGKFNLQDQSQYLGLDKHIIDGRIEVTPIDDEEGDPEDPESKSGNLAADIWSRSLFYFSL